MKVRQQQYRNSKNGLMIPPLIRDNRIDSIRGLLLLFMTIDHYGGWMSTYTWEPFGFISAAEGFIFMSGFVFAIVYGRYVVNYGLLAVKVGKRLLNIYCYHIFMLIGLTLLMVIFPFFQQYWENSFKYFSISPMKYFLASLLLVNQPPLMDILPVYIAVVLFSWPILVLLSKGWNWLVLLMSFIIWGVGQYYDPVYLAQRFFQGAPPISFNIFSWQLVFFLGVYFGFKKKHHLLSSVFQQRITIILTSIVLIILLLIKYHVIFLNNELIFKQTFRYNVGWLRLANFLLLVYLASYMLRKVPITAKIPWVNFLGQHSLQVFSFHIVVFYFFLIPLGAGSEIYAKYGNVVYLTILFLFLLSLSAPAYVHKMFVRTKKYSPKGSG